MFRETTVIIPTYNQAQFLERCLRSLLNQKNYTDFEVICVNDGSTDKTDLILERYRNEIKILHNLENRGLPYSVNKAILESKGQFVIRVDSDDFVSEHFLSFLTIALKSNADIDAIACDYELVGESARGRIANCLEEPIACGILFRRDNLFEIGLYDEQFLIHEDKELMARFLRRFQVTRLPIPLYRYRMHQNNLTKKQAESEIFLQKLVQKNKESH